MTGEARATRCERTRVWAALAPDGELAALERRLLDAHLAHCTVCRSFADDVAWIAAELRAAAAERTGRRLVLPATLARHRTGGRLRAVASVAAVAAMALGVAARTPFAGEAERRPSIPGPTPAEVEDAELQTLRLLRREALLSRIASPEGQSGTFGNRPA